MKKISLLIYFSRVSTGQVLTVTLICNEKLNNSIETPAMHLTFNLFILILVFILLTGAFNDNAPAKSPAKCSAKCSAKPRALQEMRYQKDMEISMGEVSLPKGKFLSSDSDVLEDGSVNSETKY